MANMIPPDALLRCYREGMFPMADEERIRLFSPDPRGILPLETFHVPHGTRRTLRDPAWTVTVDTVFEEVLVACADRDETWIDETIFYSYMALHHRGQAHSVEVWRDGELAGGLYGVRLGAAFFGESMFHDVTGASKVALERLVAILKVGGFELLDLQWTTPHLEKFGAVAIPRKDYLARLAAAVEKSAVFPAPGPLGSFTAIAPSP